MTEVVIVRGLSDDPKRFSELTRLNLPPVARHTKSPSFSRYHAQRELTFIESRSIRPPSKQSICDDTDVILSAHMSFFSEPRGRGWICGPNRVRLSQTIASSEPRRHAPTG
jgi:hypothetical protein